MRLLPSHKRCPGFLPGHASGAGCSHDLDQHKTKSVKTRTQGLDFGSRLNFRLWPSLHVTPDYLVLPCNAWYYFCVLCSLCLALAAALSDRDLGLTFTWFDSKAGTGGKQASCKSFRWPSPGLKTLHHALLWMQGQPSNAILYQQLVRAESWPISRSGVLGPRIALDCFPWREWVPGNSVVSKAGKPCKYAESEVVGPEKGHPRRGGRDGTEALSQELQIWGQTMTKGSSMG